MANDYVGVGKTSVCVVIPTCNRLEVLKKTLSALEEQTIMPDRVVIIDDGSSREDIDCLTEFVHKLKFPVSLIGNSPKKGPAAARNKGITSSKEDIILFINDDTVPYGRNFVESHLVLVGKFPDSSIMGPFGKNPEYRNDFLHSRWVDKLGVEASYGISTGEILSFYQFCTANVCVPRRFLTDCLFDENFPYAAHEDTDLGYRLHLKGVPLRYNPDSLVAHLHHYTPELLLERQEKIGKSLSYLLKRHPELAVTLKPKVPSFLCRFVQPLLETPLNAVFPKDFVLFLRGLLMKYNSFYGSNIGS